MTVPYAPGLLANPVINPVVGGYGLAVPYLSPSQYRFAPTAMDLTNLVVAGDYRTQDQALSDLIRRSSAMIDRYCFGADPSAKGASLCATQSIETAWLRVLQGELKLICDYKPIVEVTGIAAGMDPSTVVDIDQTAANRIRFGHSTIYVPIQGAFNATPSRTTLLNTVSTLYGRVFVAWSYINGYPHTKLTSNISAGATSFTVYATTPDGRVAGVYPGTQLRIVDGADTETVTVASISGNVVTTASPINYDHMVPDDPDFLPVTTIPSDVEQAAIFMTTYLIKERGDDSLSIMEIGEPEREAKMKGDAYEDMAMAMEYLDHYRIVTKVKS